MVGHHIYSMSLSTPSSDTKLPNAIRRGSGQVASPAQSFISEFIGFRHTRQPVLQLSDKLALQSMLANEGHRGKSC